MKEFIEKLIGRLEETRWTTIFDTSCIFENDKLDKCIEIVNELADEYKDKEYCWQECASTEHCKECSRLGNGDIDYFESIDDWAESLPIIDAGELLGNSVNDGWIPCSERLPEEKGAVLVTYQNVNDDVRVEVTIYEPKRKSFWVSPNVIAWQPLPAPYQPKGEQICT